MGKQRNFMRYTAHLAVLRIRKMKITKAKYMFLVEIPIKKQMKVGMWGAGDVIDVGYKDVKGINSVYESGNHVCGMF
jgi:hypothetical protein